MYENATTKVYRRSRTRSSVAPKFEFPRVLGTSGADDALHAEREITSDVDLGSVISGSNAFIYLVANS